MTRFLSGDGGGRRGRKETKRTKGDERGRKGTYETNLATPLAPLASCLCRAAVPLCSRAPCGEAVSEFSHRSPVTGHQCFSVPVCRRVDEPKDTKETKDAKETKDTKEAEETNDTKDTNELTS